MRDDDEPDADTEDDAVFAKMIPRKVNAWIYPTIAAEFIERVLRAAAASFDDLGTVFSQRWNYEDERSKWAAEAGFQIEALEGGYELALVESDEDEDVDGCD